MNMSTIAFATAAAMSCVAQAAHTAPKIVDADETAVAHCTFLRDVNGRSVFGERLKGPAVEKAKESARADAAKAGATHIVWGKPESSDITTIAGKAYRCGG